MTAIQMFNLLMKSHRSTPPSEQFQACGDEIVDKVRVMMLQEDSSTYRCGDYLRRRKMEKRQARALGVDECAPTLRSEIDTLCREKMCEWAYRVVDHFLASREVVSIAFCYLDLFVDRCSCDRSAFKLAAMTAIYMATKIFNSREISMNSLAELSRGEFDVAHMIEMEGVILQTLEWRMHPPTVQCFIDQLHALLPLPKGSITRAIYERATFFAELSIFDYSFVTQPKSTIAVAALMNAIEGVEGIVSNTVLDTFYKAISDVMGHCHTKETIELIRSRLWYVYSQSDQYLEDDVVPVPQKIPSEASFPIRPAQKGDLLGGNTSPVSVSIAANS